MIKLHIWANYFGGWNKENYEFPFENKRGQQFENAKELLEYITREFGDDASSGLYYSTLLTAPINLLFDREIQGWIERYQFCTKFNVRPFNAEVYDELPAFWVDFVKIMEDELIKCQRENGRHK